MSGRRVCKFFQQGNCRNGRNCQFQHVYENNNNDAGNRSWGSSNSLKSEIERFWSDSTLDAKEAEVKSETNEYRDFETVPVTSAFGLGFPAAVNLIDGRDYSLEESRWEFYQARDNNTIPEYERQLALRKQDMGNCIDYLRQNAKKGARYTQLITKSKHQDPSASAKPFMPEALNLSGRLQPTNASPFGTSTGGAFGSQSAGNPFGKQAAGSAFGGQSLGSAKPAGASAFGSSGFGTSAMGASSTTGGAFGAQNTGSAFGSSSFGSGTTGTSVSPFGTTSTTGTVSAFGSSGFGSATNKPSAFGSSGFGSSSTNTNSSSAFGSSGFGSASTGANKASPFGGSSLGSTTATTKTLPFGSSGFGSNATSSSASAFGSSGFGQKAVPSSTASPFGHIPTNSTSPFGQNSTTTTSPFGAAATTATTSAFGSQFTNTNAPFGTQSNNSLFGQTSAAPKASPFGQVATSTTSPFGLTNTAAPFGSTRTNGFGSGTFNGFATVNGGEFKPSFTQSAIEPSRVSKDDLSDAIRKEFEALTFQLGKIPEIPPPLAYC